LKKFVKDNFNGYEKDLFSAFIIRNREFAKNKGQLGFMSPFVWMFISSYEKLRKHLIKHTCITSLVQLEYSGFDGATVPICTFTLANLTNPYYKGGYIKLSDFKGAENQAPRTIEAIANPDCGWFFRCKTSDFAKIPGAPIAYWVSDKIRDIFISSKPLADVASPKQGLATADNDRFLRLWFETSRDRIGFGMKNRQEARQSGKKWFPCNKGGSFRRWYGNNDYIVNWENDGEEIRNFSDDKGKLRSRPQNHDFYFMSGWSWSTISSSKASFRFSPIGFMFETKGSVCFPMDIGELNELGGFLNSVLICDLLQVLSPTLDFHEGPLSKLPYIHIENNDKIDRIVEQCVHAVETDWDSYETSWDFQRLPLLGVRCQGLGIRECYAKLREQWIESTLKMQELEEENNRIFIEAYGLQEELSPEVPLKEITLTCNPYYRYGVNPEVLGVRALGVREFPLNAELEKRLLADTMKELISYAVGCMFGRYSLDKPGLILANQGEGVEDYFDKVLGVSGLGVRGDDSGEAALKPNTQNLKPSFMPDKDNVIPILEGEWFVDDIVSRFTDFLKVAFGAEKYSENISFIEEAIGKPLRNYFLKDFYTDHVKRYKKRPIYWLFSSPKGSFNALIYMHRYTPDTVSILLNGYLREYIHKLRAKVSQLEHQLNAGDQSERDKMLTRKEIERLKDVIIELEAWESKVILPLAEKRLEIDLDDGVKVNYGKFGEALKRF